MVSKGVLTINAAYSLRLEDERGSIEPGKLANFTVLDQNPLSVDPMAIKDIEVWGTVMEGRVLKVGHATQKDAGLPIGKQPGATEFASKVLHHAVSVVHAHL